MAAPAGTAGYRLKTAGVAVIEASRMSWSGRHKVRETSDNRVRAIVEFGAGRSRASAKVRLKYESGKQDGTCAGASAPMREGKRVGIRSGMNDG